MRFGLFGGARSRSGTPVGEHQGGDSQGYRDYINYVREAEDLGFESVFVVEHHFTGVGQVSASLELLSYLAGGTTRIRLGTAVVVLPWHNPVLLAEQAATVDLLSNGRLDFGVGKGYRDVEFDGFCVPMEEATERFDEAMDDHPQGVDHAPAASRITASAGITITSSSSRRRCSARTRRSGSAPAATNRSAAPRAKATTCCSTRSRPRSHHRARRHVQGRVPEGRPRLRSGDGRHDARLAARAQRRRSREGAGDAHQHAEEHRHARPRPRRRALHADQGLQRPADRIRRCAAARHARRDHRAA